MTKSNLSKDLVRDKHSKALHPTNKAKEDYLKKIKEETKQAMVLTRLDQLESQVTKLTEVVAGLATRLDALQNDKAVMIPSVWVNCGKDTPPSTITCSNDNSSWTEFAKHE